ncbi:MAG: hypothetical protein ACRD59_05400 [Candidatus Acidiferrales bacterium]
MRENSTTLSDFRVFISSIARHWKAFITGSIFAALLWLIQGAGLVTIRRWVYWTVASLALLGACYQAWLDQQARIDALTSRLNDTNDERKKMLIRVLTALRSLESKIAYWRDITNGKWGMAKPAEKLQLDDLSTILFEAEKIDRDLRTTVEGVVSKTTHAESLIAQFMCQPPAYKQDWLMKQAYIQLDESAPMLSQVVAEFEAFEKKLR